MEVVGGIASFIAIGQALGAIPKIITAVKSVTNARDELQDLLLEVHFLSTTLSRDAVLKNSQTKSLRSSSSDTIMQRRIYDCLHPKILP